MLAVNDLFIGQCTHTSAQYDIYWNEKQENQSSSEIIVSTGLGATGWYKSVITEAQHIAGILTLGVMWRLALPIGKGNWYTVNIIKYLWGG